MKTSDLSIKELAAFIGVSTDTIRRAARKGEIPVTRVGSRQSQALLRIYDKRLQMQVQERLDRRGLRASEGPVRCSPAEPSHCLRRWRADASAKGARGCRQTPPILEAMLLTIKDLSRQLNINHQRSIFGPYKGRFPVRKSMR